MNMANPSLSDHDQAQSEQMLMRQRISRRSILLFSVFSILGQQLFTNNVLLLYFIQGGIPPSRVVFYLSLPIFLACVIQIPCAFLADRYGRKRLGGTGYQAMIAGFLLMALTVFMPQGQMEYLLVPGLVLMGLGKGLYLSSWFVLMKGSVRPESRGRFFGILRTSWQSAGMLFTLFCTWLLAGGSELWRFGLILMISQTGYLFALYFYYRIADLEPVQETLVSFRAALLDVMTYPRFLPFCSYVFLLRLFTMSMPVLFALVMKDVLELPGDRVVLMQLVLMIGAISGYYLGGVLIDRIGTRLIFLVAHMGFALLAGLFLARAMAGSHEQVFIGAIHFLFGVIVAVSSIAVSTELMVLMPPRHQSLGSSVGIVSDFAGVSLSGIFASLLIQLDLFRPDWELMGWTLSAYDGILLIFGMMVLILVVTLGLIPSVIAQSQWIPKGGMSH